MHVCAKHQTRYEGPLLYLEQDLEGGQRHLAHLQHHTAHVLAYEIAYCVSNIILLI